MGWIRSEAIVHSAIARKESRGGPFREDYDQKKAELEEKKGKSKKGPAGSKSAYLIFAGENR